MSCPDVEISIRTSILGNRWAWEVTIDGNSWYGYEPDYFSAEGQVRDLLREVLRDE